MATVDTASTINLMPLSIAEYLNLTIDRHASSDLSMAKGNSENQWYRTLQAYNWPNHQVDFSSAAERLPIHTPDRNKDLFPLPYGHRYRELVSQPEVL